MEGVLALLMAFLLAAPGTAAPPASPEEAAVPEGTPPTKDLFRVSPQHFNSVVSRPSVFTVEVMRPWTNHTFFSIKVDLPEAVRTDLQTLQPELQRLALAGWALSPNTNIPVSYDPPQGVPPAGPGRDAITPLPPYYLEFVPTGARVDPTRDPTKEVMKIVERGIPMNFTLNVTVHHYAWERAPADPHGQPLDWRATVVYDPHVMLPPQPRVHPAPPGLPIPNPATLPTYPDALSAYALAYAAKYAADADKIAKALQSEMVTVDQARVTFRGVVDNEPPSAALVSTPAEPAGGWFRVPPTVELIASDPTTGIASQRYRIDGGPWTDYSVPLVLEDRAQTRIEFEVKDLAGNPATGSATFRVDSVPPVTSLLVPDPAGALDPETGRVWHVALPEVELAGEDATSSVAETRYTLVSDGEMIAEDALYSGPFTLPEGRLVTLSYHSIDVAGNAEEPTTAELSIDASAPELVVTRDPVAPDGNDPWHVSTPRVTLSASDAGPSGLASLEWRLADGEFQDYEDGFEIGIPEGTASKLEIRARDAAGHEIAAVEEFAVDLTDPVVEAFVPEPSSTGWHLEAPEVRLDASDAPSGVRLVERRILVDGEPQGDWTADDGTTVALPEGASVVLEFWGEDNAGRATGSRDAPLAIDAQEVDLTDPTLALTLPDPTESGWHLAGARASLHAEDATSGPGDVEYRLLVDGEELLPWTSYTGAFDLPEGEDVVIEHRASDVAGRSTGVLRSDSLRVDATDPSTTLSISPGEPDGLDGWYLTTPEATLSTAADTSGVDVTEYRLDAGEWTPYDGSPIPIPEGKAIALEYRSTDKAGNVEATKSTTFRVDATAPSTTLTLSPDAPDGDGGWFRTTPRVTLAATDATSEGVSIEYRLVLDGEAIGDLVAYDGPFTLPDGSVEVEVTSKDAAGNAEAVRREGPYLVSATLPAAPDLEALETYTSVSEVALAWAASTAGASGFKEYVLQRDAGDGFVDLATFTDLAATSHVDAGVSEGARYAYRVLARDNAGNERAGGVAVTTIDTLAPGVEITLDGEPEGEWYLKAPTATVVATDATSPEVSTECRVTAGTKTMREWTAYDAPLQLPDGEVTLECRATDAAGHVGTASTSVRVDANAPSIALTTDPAFPTGSGWFLSAITVTLDAPDAGSGLKLLEYRVGDGDYTEFADPLAVAEGETTLEARATDFAGNVATLSRTFKVDSTRPKVSIGVTGDKSPTTGWYLAPPTVELGSSDSGSGPAAIEYRFGAADYAPYDGALVTPEGNPVALEVRAFDVAGNFVEVRQELLVDGTPPETALRIAEPDGLDGWHVTPPAVTLEAADATSGPGAITYSVTVDGVATTSDASYEGPFSLPAGASVVVTYGAQDVAGNAEATRTSATFRIDPTPPDLGLQAAEPGGDDGWHLLAPVVTLAAPDAGSGLDRIEYRLDGAEYQRYTEPFAIPAAAAVLLEARAFDAAGGVASLVRAFKVDSAAPETTLAVAPRTEGNDGWLIERPLATLAAADGEGSGVRETTFSVVADGAQAIEESPFAAPFGLPDGASVVVRYRSRDFAGQREEARESAAFRIDATPPAIEITLPAPDGDAGWYRTLPRATVRATDAMSGLASFETALGSGDWSAALENPATLELPAGAGVTASVRAKDFAGNAFGAAIGPLNVDVVAPEATATHPEADGLDGWHRTIPAVTLAGTDDGSGLASLTYSIVVDGAVQTEGAVYGEPVALPEGSSVVVHYAARDLAGNVGEARSTPALRIDATAPLVSDTTAARVTAGNDLALRLCARDNVGASARITVEVPTAGSIEPLVLDAGPTPVCLTSTEGKIRVPTGATGEVRWTVVATDRAGNSHTLEGSAKIDRRPPPPPPTPDPEPAAQNEPPLLAISAPLTARAGEAILLRADASDPDGIVTRIAWDLGDGTPAEGRAVSHAFLVPGVYTIVVSAFDNAGGRTTVRNPIAIQEAAPAPGAPLPAAPTPPVTGPATPPVRTTAGTAALTRAIESALGLPPGPDVILQDTDGNGREDRLLDPADRFRARGVHVLKGEVAFTIARGAATTPTLLAFPAEPAVERLAVVDARPAPLWPADAGSHPYKLGGDASAPWSLVTLVDPNPGAPLASVTRGDGGRIEPGALQRADRVIVVLAQGTDELTVHLDAARAPPTQTRIDAGPDGPTRSPREIRVDAPPGSRAFIRLDDGAWIEGATRLIRDDGPHLVCAFADVGGTALGTATCVRILVDGSAPTFRSIGAIPGGATQGKPVRIVLSVDDAGAGVESVTATLLLQDGSTLAILLAPGAEAGTYEATVTPTAPGTHRIVATATDKVGNAAGTEAWLTVDEPLEFTGTVPGASVPTNPPSPQDTPGAGVGLLALAAIAAAVGTRRRRS